MKTWVPVLLGCILVATSHAQSRREVYQWRDANGVTHFSDYPQPGARKIILNGAPQSTTAPQAAAATSEQSRSSRPTAQRPGQYDALEIVSPYNEQAFFEPDVVIPVNVRSQPALHSQDRLVTYLDGKPLGDFNQTEHSLSGLVRGAHTLQSVIYDSTGTEAIRSEMVTFFMRQPSVANPRNQGPAVRPPPRPQPR
jgi:hypothetical protein